MSTEKSIEQCRLEILHWERDNRNLNTVNVSSKGMCYYTAKGDNPFGCAIGRMLPASLCKELDSFASSDKSSGSPTVASQEVFNMLPKSIQNLGIDFLTELQNLHDMVNNWNYEGLSSLGTKVFEDIKQKYCQDIPV